MRVRTPRNTGTLKNIGKFPSIKNGKMIWFESHLERDFIYQIEFDQSILSYQEQPFKVTYSLNGKHHTYTPDFLIRKSDKNQIIEIKPQPKSETDEFIIFSNSMTKLLAEKGYEYLVITDSTIRIQPRLSNIKLLWRYARMPINAKNKIFLHELFCKSKELSLSQVSSFLSDVKEKKELIYALLFHEHLLIDIDKPITADSLISMGNIFK